MINFYDDLMAKTLETIKEAYDCVDILCDLGRIERTRANVYSLGGTAAAAQLNQELREKYPAINTMLDIANAMLLNPLLAPQPSQTRSAEEIALSSLQQDYYGILCDTAVKKGLKQSIKDCIKNVD